MSFDRLEEIFTTLEEAKAYAESFVDWRGYTMTWVEVSDGDWRLQPVTGPSVMRVEEWRVRG